jgi:cytochrome c peroxidase
MRTIGRRVRRHVRAGLLFSLLSLAVGCASEGRARDARHSLDRESREAAEARASYRRGIDTLAARIGAVARALESGKGREARAAFEAARLAFKRIEYAAAYYQPSTTRALNGPPFDRVEEGDPQIAIPAEGLQVLDAFVVAAPDSSSLRDARRHAANIASLVTRLARAAAATPFTDARVFDAARLELARVASLGLAGFDVASSAAALIESAAALDGIADAIEPFRSLMPRALSAELRTALDSAISDLRGASDAEAFDRLSFIVRRVIPLGSALASAQESLGVPYVDERRGLDPRAPSPFAAGAFVPAAFAPHDVEPASPALVALGRRLFFDPVLSGSGNRSCATCHVPERAFTDGLARSPSLTDAPLRNAPSLINAGLQSAQFADLRVAYLEDQVTAVVGSRDEMHGSLSAAAARLGRDSAWTTAFRTAFGAADSIVTARRLRSAVAAYARSLQALNSPFDRHLRGDTAAMAPEARRGFNVFMGKARCGTCHFAPLFNGTVPPMYAETEVEVIGVPDRATRRGARIAEDQGRRNVTRAELHTHAFKTPTVRNVELTAPYMHNGVFRTLAEVIDFYDAGGGAGWGIAPLNQTLPADSLRLTAAEKRELGAFLRALTDTGGTTRRP